MPRMAVIEIPRAPHDGVRATVIIPVHNMAPTLAAALTAALAETGAGDEVIVVDDASTDDSAAVATRFPVRHLRLPHNLGAAGARLAAAQQARGRYVVLTDADAELLPGAVERLLAPLEAGSADVVVGIYSAEPGASDVVSRFKNAWIRYTYLQTQPQVDWVFGCITALPRELFLAAAAEIDAPTELEDFDLGFALQRRGARFHMEPGAEARHHRVHNMAGLMSNDFRRARDGILLGGRNLGLRAFVRRGRLGNIGSGYAIGAGLAGSVALATALGWPWLALALFAAHIAVNARLYVYLYRQGGTELAGAGVGLQLLSQAAALAGACSAATRWPRSRKPS